MSVPYHAVTVKGRGRMYQHPVTLEQVPSITNILNVLEKPALKYWAAKRVAEQAWILRHTLDELGEEEVVDLLKGAPWRKSKRSAARGTTIHEYLHAAANGAAPPDLVGDAKQYRKAADEFLDRYQPDFVETEVSVWGDGYAGTADAFALLGGRLCVVDYKTSSDLYPEIALQLSAIANASQILRESHADPMPQVEACVGVLLTPDGCDVREIDVSGAYTAFQGLLAAWKWKVQGVEMRPLLVEVGT